MVLSRRASSRSIAPTGGGRVAAGGCRLESLCDLQLGLRGLGGAAKGTRLINTIRQPVTISTRYGLLAGTRRPAAPGPASAARRSRGVGRG
eukprot:6687029-Prymnesium_polylepis.1